MSIRIALKGDYGVSPLSNSAGIYVSGDVKDNNDSKDLDLPPAPSEINFEYLYNHRLPTKAMLDGEDEAGYNKKFSDYCLLDSTEIRSDCPSHDRPVVKEMERQGGPVHYLKPTYPVTAIDYYRYYHDYKVNVDYMRPRPRETTTFFRGRRLTTRNRCLGLIRVSFTSRAGERKEFELLEHLVSLLSFPKTSAVISTINSMLTHDTSDTEDAYYSRITGSMSVKEKEEFDNIVAECYCLQAAQLIAGYTNVAINYDEYSKVEENREKLSYFAGFHINQLTVPMDRGTAMYGSYVRAHRTCDSVAYYVASMLDMNRTYGSLGDSPRATYKSESQPYPVELLNDASLMFQITQAVFNELLDNGLCRSCPDGCYQGREVNIDPRAKSRLTPALGNNWQEHVNECISRIERYHCSPVEVASGYVLHVPQEDQELLGRQSYFRGAEGRIGNVDPPRAVKTQSPSGLIDSMLELWYIMSNKGKDKGLTDKEYYKVMADFMRTRGGI